MYRIHSFFFCCLLHHSATLPLSATTLRYSGTSLTSPAQFLLSLAPLRLKPAWEMPK